MRQALLTALYTRLALRLEPGKFVLVLELRQNKTSSFEKNTMTNFQIVRPQCGLEKIYKRGIQKKTDV